jgi:hypothetical protein
VRRKFRLELIDLRFAADASLFGRHRIMARYAASSLVCLLSVVKKRCSDVSAADQRLDIDPAFVFSLATFTRASAPTQTRWYGQSIELAEDALAGLTLSR